MKKLIAIFTAALLICSVIVPVSAESTALTGLYHSKFYSTYSDAFTFDPEAETITTKDTVHRAMINYSHDMTTFEASFTAKSTKNNGFFQVGMAFHVQDADAKTSNYNPKNGYLVFVRRDTTNKNKLTLGIRYRKNGASGKTDESTYKTTSFSTDINAEVKFKLKVTETDFTVTVLSASGTELIKTAALPLNDGGINFASGALEIGGNGPVVYSDFSVISYGLMADIPTPDEIPSVGGGGQPTADALSTRYDVFDDVTTDSNNYTTTTDLGSKGTLKSGSKNDFSTALTIKANASNKVKAGIIFRASNLGSASKDDMQCYSVIVDGTGSSIRLYLYKYGEKSGANGYLGNIGSSVLCEDITLTSGKEIVLDLNVSGEWVEAYFYDKANPSVKSDTLNRSLKNATSQNNTVYYADGKIGYYVGQGSFANFMDIVIGDARQIDTGITGGMAAVDNSKGSAVRGSGSSISNVTASNVSAPTVNNLDEYAADFYNYTTYSDSASTRFIVTDDGLVADTTGAKRAILDGVTVKGFHATATMRISSEGTLRSGIVFRVNNIEKGLSDKGLLGSNDIEGYAAILYKTPGTTESQARVVLCIYKYGIVKGKYQYLGTVASKASTVPLTGCEKKESDAAGQELTIDVNVIGDELSAYFYNTKNPTLKSETLVTSLKNETDSEKNKPSLKGVHYEKGGIGLTTSSLVTFTGFTVAEPIYPSTAVGDLSKLDSYTLYGSGVTEKDGYFVANSSGTKKLMVNNLTVTDFTASVDMTIDKNGNLKAGFFFRNSSMGNGADDQEGFAAIVTRNFSTNGENNPNRIDIVIFKWGYLNGKLSYLGEVAREVYKSGASFMDGKMAGEELTFVVRVKGASLEASLYHKKNPDNKPLIFSSNLKFAATKEKNGAAYFESGAIGLYFGNSVSDPLNETKLRNFHIDDGSGVKVKSSSNSKASTILGIIPVTKRTTPVIAIGTVLVVAAAAVFGVYIYRKRGKTAITGDIK